MNLIFKFSLLKREALYVIYLFLFLPFLLNAQLPSGFNDARVLGVNNTPMGLAFSKNGQKMFIWEKKGTVLAYNWDGLTYVQQPTPMIDLSEEVGNWSDLGLSSFVLDPNFDSNGLVYLYYQVDRHYLLNFGTPQYSSTTDDYNSATISRVTRYKINTSGSTMSVDKASRKILLGETKSTGIPSVYSTHTGGQLIFGTDGTLLLTTGDNATFNGADVGSNTDTYWQQAIADGIMRSTENVGSFRSQMLNSFCGKLLRIDPNTGDGLPSNPHYDASNPRSAKSRVWALGFRNPFRCTLKPGTGSTSATSGNPGTIIVGDVQAGAREELHIIEKSGLNCGWPVFEGLNPATLFVGKTTQNQEESGQPTFISQCVQPTSATLNSDPKQRRFTHFPAAIDWDHRDNLARYPDFSGGNLQAKSIGSAGAKVAGNQFYGACVIGGGFYTGTAFPSQYRNTYFFADFVEHWIKVAVIQDNSDPQIKEIRDFAPTGFGEGIIDMEMSPIDGAMYYLNIRTGQLRRISFGGNRPPVATISSNKTSGASPLVVNFSSSGSNDPEGGALTYLWDFGDGNTSTSANPSYTFNATGTRAFTVSLTVKDNGGLTDTKSMTISVNNTAPTVKITSPTNNSTYSLLQPTVFTPQITVTDNDQTNMTYSWILTLNHNTHNHPNPPLTQKNPSIELAPVGCDGETYYYTLSVTVKDNGGLTTKDEIRINPDCNGGNLSITNLKATAQGSGSVAVSWSNPPVSFDGLMVVAKANSGFLSNPSGTNYTANANFTGNGSDFEGGKVVYLGTGNNVTVSGLTSGTRYYFRVFTRKGTAWTGGVETSATPSGTTPPPTVTAFYPHKCYRLTARHSNKVMELASTSTADGITLVQGTWNNLSKQYWRIQTSDNAFYWIKSAYSGKVLDVKGAFTSDGAAIQQLIYNGGSNQFWKFERNTEGYYVIRAKHSNKVIDVKGDLTTDDARIQQYTSNGGANQQWSVAEVGCPTGALPFETAKIYTASGYQNSRKAVLKWVSNATDADYFIVEKRNSKGQFDTLSYINAKPPVGNSLKKDYTFMDNETIEGDNTYRIQLISYTTSPQYSNLINLNFKSSAEGMLFPNPTADNINIDLRQFEGKPVNLYIYNTTGMLLKKVAIPKATAAPQKVDIQDLDNGSYFIRIRTDGKRDITRPFYIIR
jgi:glucose/arabinose dehydrogenase